MKWSDYIKSF